LSAREERVKNIESQMAPSAVLMKQVNELSSEVQKLKDIKSEGVAAFGAVKVPFPSSMENIKNRVLEYVPGSAPAVESGESKGDEQVEVPRQAGGSYVISGYMSALN
jgi:hypothetical protein